MKELSITAEKVDLPDELEIKNAQLYFRNISLLQLALNYGTPLRFTFLPSITEKIRSMVDYFQKAIKENNYHGSYTYFYCTKSSHFRHVLNKVLQAGTGIEISSSYDIELIQSLIDDGSISKKTRIICNGYKTKKYQDGIVSLINDGFSSVVPVIDSKRELLAYIDGVKTPTLEVGIRVNLSYLSPYSLSSRFGISPEEILSFYQNDLANNSRVKLSTLHFFNEKGIDGEDHYWDVLEDVVRLYCKLKNMNPALRVLDIGGGMPFRSKLNDTFDFQSWVQRIVSTIQKVCHQYRVNEPDIVTEFGKYTVAEATGIIFKVLEEKTIFPYNWAVIDGSFITHLPDTWAINQMYPALPVNNWNAEFKPFILGGLTCDSADYYPNSGQNENDGIMLPSSQDEQFVAILNTGAYQEALSGFGGISHCLIPSPKHIIIDKYDDHTLDFSVFSETQTSGNLLNILGYQ